MSPLRPRFIAFLLCLAPLASTRAGVITEIGPFVGELTEDWEWFPNPSVWPFLPDPTEIMGGAATISAPIMAVYEAFDPDPPPGSSPFFIGLGTSGMAQVAEGNQGMLSGPDGAIVTLVFEAPIRRFGSFWGATTSTNPTFGTDPAIIELSYYDEMGSLVASTSFSYTRSQAQGYTADGMLEWHGWHFDVPVLSIAFSGNFVALDGMQADFVPEPGTMTLLIVGLIFAVKGRARKSLEH